MPCFDEAERLDTEAFADLAQHVDEVIFVDDGSTDGTAVVVRRLMVERPGRVDLIVLPKNVGKAEAVRVGLLDAIERGSAVVGYLARSAVGPGEYLLRMSGAQRVSAGIYLVAAAANVGLCFALVPALGLMGAALGGAIAMVLAAVLNWVAARRCLGIEIGIWAHLRAARTH